MLPETPRPSDRPRRTRLLAASALIPLTATLVAVVPNAASAAAAPSTLTAGHNLTAGQKLLSPDAAVYLIMQGDGNLVAYGGGRSLWSSGTAGHSGAYAVMQTDGNLVVRSTTTALWNSHSAGTGTANRLAIQDDGNVVVYTSANKPVWTASSHISTLMAGVTLTPGQMLYSPDDKVRLVMQGDGNLVLYSGSSALWQSKTAGHAGAYATLQTDGNLVVRNATTALFNTGTAGKGGNRLVLQSDHNLVLYTASGAAVWQSGTRTAPPVSSPKAYAQQYMLTQYGWGADQFQYLDQLWTRESGWNYAATNPSSGAYGIPQSLPGNKMASAGADWQTNPDTQIRWGLSYIAGRYGNPAAAWSHETQYGWY